MSVLQRIRSIVKRNSAAAVLGLAGLVGASLPSHSLRASDPSAFPVAIEAAAPTIDYIIPTAASAPGLRDSKWVTDVWLSNLDTNPMVINCYLPNGTLGDAVASLTVAPGTSTTLRDIVGTTFNRPGASGMIALDVVSANAERAIITSGTYNQQVDGGIAGTGVPTLSPTNTQHFFPPGTTSYAPLATTPDTLSGGVERASLGLVTMDAGATATVVLRDTLGRDKERRALTLPPWTRQQTLATDTFSVPLERDDRVEVTVLTGTLACYTTVADNRSNSPVLHPGAATMPVWSAIAGAANSPGQNGTLWQTDLTLTNTADTATDLVVRYVPRDTTPDLNTQYLILPLPARSTQSIGNILDTVFKVTGGAGALHIETRQPTIALASRTFNNSPAGTYGVALARDTTSDGAVNNGTWASDRVANNITQMGGTHTNVALTNVTGTPTTATLSYTSAGGTPITTTTHTLPAWATTQVPAAVPMNTENATVRLHVQDLGAAVTLHAYTINNATGQGFNQPGTPMYVDQTPQPPLAEQVETYLKLWYDPIATNIVYLNKAESYDHFNGSFGDKTLELMFANAAGYPGTISDFKALFHSLFDGDMTNYETCQTKDPVEFQMQPLHGYVMVGIAPGCNASTTALKTTDTVLVRQNLRDFLKDRLIKHPDAYQNLSLDFNPTWNSLDATKP